jgi:hypothetical protein
MAYGFPTADDRSDQRHEVGRDRSVFPAVEIVGSIHGP